MNQLFDASQVEAGKLSIAPEPADLVALIEQVVANARETTDKHAIRVAFSSSVQAPIDSVRLNRC